MTTSQVWAGLRLGDGHGAATVPRSSSGALRLASLLASSTTPASTPRTPGACARSRRRSSAAGDLALERVEAPAATREQILRVHTRRPLRRLEAFCAGGGGMIDMDTLAVEASFDAALHAAGGAAEAAERAARRRGERGLLRDAPAGPSRRAGSARWASACSTASPSPQRTRSRPAAAERVLILDWDVHHGNGTEEIFAASGDVLYASIHQSPLYPGTGPAEYAGEGAGEGYTVNLPVPPGSGDATIPRPRRARGRADRAPVRAGPDRDLGRLRRPPRRSARQLLGRPPRATPR